MLNDYLKDNAFLKKIDQERLKEQYVKITLLNWEEKPIQDLTGLVTGGSINLDGKSSIRRTANISAVLSNQYTSITNPKNLLSINKKIKIFIGLKNTTQQYQDYPILWFPMGTYVIIQSSISHSLSGINVSLQLKDKMCLLNGECGGTFPASINFGEIETIDDKGNPIILKPTLYQIIQEVVNHWGGEQLGKIIISDLDTKIKKVMKWTGNTPLYCYKHSDGNFIFTTNTSLVQNFIKENDFDSLLNGEVEHYIQCNNGDDVGYIYSDFTYETGELIGDIGGNVCNILDKIRDLLGNYEYYYDVDGNFIFQEIKNYLNTSQSTFELNKIKNSDYLIDTVSNKATYSFDDSLLISSYANNPQFNMIKNDFIVWGKRKDATGKEYPIRFHLAIDKKPKYGNTHKVFKYEDPKDHLLKAKATYEVFSLEELPKPGMQGIFYLFNGLIYEWSPEKYDYVTISNGELINLTSNDWRTELYLQGVDAEPFGTSSNPYYIELQNEWPKLYDIWSSDGGHFFPDKEKHPNDCDYFLDFIDSDAAISEFSIQNIGKRTKSIVDNDVNCIFAPEIPDLILIEAGQPDSNEKRKDCERKNLRYSQVESSIYNTLAIGGHFNSAYDLIKSLLSQYTSYNESISIQTIPIFHLEPNTRISVIDKDSDIFGDYIINSFSIPLTSTGTMSISATRALQKI